MSWRESRVSDDRTHHVVGDEPMYEARFDEVLAFHAPGLAAAQRGDEGIHVLPSGVPAYARRYRRTFGFYEGLAAAVDDAGWMHVQPDGSPAYPDRHAWVGNFQGGRCAVRFLDGSYAHLRPDGVPAYPERYRYAGDFREGIAVVLREDGRHVHVDRDGRPLGTGAWTDLGPFHKGFATACDDRGWTHVDRSGKPVYGDRYVAVEPFYNGQARVVAGDAAMYVISETGRREAELRPPRNTTLQGLSARMVGLWSTHAIHAAVELGILDALPGTEAELAERSGVPEVRRLLMGLWELGLVAPGDAAATWVATPAGRLLRSSDPSGMAAASSHWAVDSQTAWTRLADSLRGRSRPPADWFADLAGNPDAVARYQRAMAGYARDDYGWLAEAIPAHQVFLDAGGGTGALLGMLLERHPGATGILLERPEVVRLASGRLHTRATAVAADIRRAWPVNADAVVLARVLHDWPDEIASEILREAHRAVTPGGRVYVVELGRRDGDAFGALLDLHLLGMTGGRERTVEEISKLLVSAGFSSPAVRNHSQGALVIGTKK